MTVFGSFILSMCFPSSLLFLPSYIIFIFSPTHLPILSFYLSSFSFLFLSFFLSSFFLFLSFFLPSFPFPFPSFLSFFLSFFTSFHLNYTFFFFHHFFLEGRGRGAGREEGNSRCPVFVFFLHSLYRYLRVSAYLGIPWPSSG